MKPARVSLPIAALVLALGGAPAALRGEVQWSYETGG